MRIFLKFKNGYFTYLSDVKVINLRNATVNSEDFKILTVTDAFGKVGSYYWDELTESCQGRIINLNEDDVK